jgi:hypothetical protein
MHITIQFCQNLSKKLCLLIALPGLALGQTAVQAPITATASPQATLTAPNNTQSTTDQKSIPAKPQTPLKPVTVHGGRLRSSDLGEELEGIELLLPA